MYAVEYVVGCSLQTLPKHPFLRSQSLYAARYRRFLPEAELSNEMAAQRLHVLRVVFFFAVPGIIPDCSSRYRYSKRFTRTHGRMW